MRILALVPGGIGDQVLFFPTIDDLHQAYPNAQIDVIVEPRSVGAYRVCPTVSKVIPFDFKDRNSLADWSNLLGTIRESEYDAVLSLGRSPLVKLLLWLTGIPIRVGYSGAANWFLTNPVPLNLNQYAGGLYHDLLKGFGIDKPCPAPSLTLRSKDIDWATAEQAKLGLQGKGYLLVHGGSSALSRAKGIDKVYPPEKWVMVLKGLQERKPDLPIVVVQGPDDAEFVAALRSAGLSFEVVKAPDLGKLAALIAAANLMLCTDSGPMHLSIAAGTPTVALFGPTDPAKLLPPGSERFKALKAASGRMTDIAPQEILETILSA